MGVTKVIWAAQSRAIVRAPIRARSGERDRQRRESLSQLMLQAREIGFGTVGNQHALIDGDAVISAVGINHYLLEAQQQTARRSLVNRGSLQVGVEREPGGEDGIAIHAVMTEVDFGSRGAQRGA